MIVFQCATPFEIEAMRAAFEAAFGGASSEKVGKRQFCSAGDCVAFRGAVGKVWAAASAEFAIARWSPDLMVDFGAAGALNPELCVGDIVVAERVVEYDVVSSNGRVRPVRLFVPEGAPGEFKRGIIAAGDRDVQTVEERRALAKKWGADAVTWETSAVARVSDLHGVPCLSVRVITDVGSDELKAEYLENASKALAPAARVALELAKRGR